jgi:hypothetical protein
MGALVGPAAHCPFGRRAHRLGFGPPGRRGPGFGLVLEGQKGGQRMA